MRGTERRAHLAALCVLCWLLVAGAGPARAAAFDALHPQFGDRHAVSHDKYTMLVDGQRLPVWSAEVHGWRLPSPGLWRDMLEKVKASGYNTISIYVNWGLTTPAPGRHELSGVNDLDRFLTIAEQVGLYVIARPGPYINSEVDAGGLPGWLGNVGATRSQPASEAYTKAWSDYWDAVVPIIARHQITRGGSVLLFQIENEYGGPLNSDQTVPAEDSRTYIRTLVERTRALGIDVPLSWNKQTSNDPTYPDLVPVGGADGYPHLSQLLTGCSQPPTAMTTPSAAVYAPDSPIFTPEFEGGSMTYWGSPGADACYRMTAPPIQRMMDQTLLSLGETMTSQYMGYGGTNWGWLAMPSTITSYDWGTAIDEVRELTPKAYEQKQFGYRWASFPDLHTTDAAGKPAGSNSDLLLALRTNPATKAQVVFLRHNRVGDDSTSETTLALDLPDGKYDRVPQDPAQQIKIAGQDGKMLLAGANVRGQRLVYSTSEPYLATSIGDRDYLAFVGRRGESGETVLRYKSRPDVEVLAGEVKSTWDAQRGDLRLDYVSRGLARVLVTSGGRPPMLLLLADDDAAAGIWLTHAGAEPVLSIGPYLVKSASLRGRRLELTGQTAARMPKVGDVGGAMTTSAWSGDLSKPAPDTRLEVFAPPGSRGMSWNGAGLPADETSEGALRATLEGPPAVKLPALTGWRFYTDTAETNPAFDDSSWTQIPAGGDLLADTYGFHHGNVWYRGRFTATGGELTAVIRAFTGGAPAGVMAWLNGQYIGSSVEQATGAYISSDSSVALTPSLAGALRPGEENVLSILVEGGHPILGVSTGGKDSPPTKMGLQEVTFGGAQPAVSWRIQGAVPDKLRSAFNNGGLGGERNGWTHHGFDDSRWPAVQLPDRWSARDIPAGVAWYRTRFALDLPRDADIPLGVRIDDDPSRNYEALIFVNGWMLGRYANALGPQHLFSLPEGILDHQGENTIAIAVISRGDSNTAGLGKVTLEAYGRYAGAALERADADVPASSGRDCSAGSRRLTTTALGLVRLGMTRAGTRARFADSSLHGKRHVDVFCSGPDRVRVGYASRPALVRALPKSLRRRFQRRVVVALTRSRRASLRGIRPGMRLRTKRKPIRIGRDRWYVIAAGSQRGVLRMRSGKVFEIGIAHRSLTADRRRARMLFSTFR